MAKKKLPVEPLKATKAIPVKIVNDVPAPSTDKSYEARERKYRAEDALRDLERAETHKRDRALMADVKKLAKEKANALKNIC